ncbi:MAG: hypothetical protein O2816_13030 [Planctomycetota bacterium]|nr:hypothetical protein [Planctomycetota bacterium]
MQALLKQFVPVADEVHRLQKADSVEGEHFRKIAEQGHYGGRTQPTDTRQGIYAAAPSGALLASINTRSAERVVAMLETALEKWQQLEQGERYLPQAERPADGGWRWLQHYPTDGLVLRVHSRDLPRDDAPEDWRGDAANRDYAWLRAAEAATFVPEQPRVGATRPIPEALARRIARLHLVDNVRGQTSPFRAQDVEQATLTSEVVAVEGKRVELLLTGTSRCAQRGRWAVNGHEDAAKPKEQERGIAVTFHGRATWDGERFSAFELVALGERWGGTKYNRRDDDLAPTGIGYALVLAGDEQVAPAFVWEYGW